MLFEYLCWFYLDIFDFYDYEWGYKFFCNDEVININKEENSCKKLEEMNWWVLEINDIWFFC